MHRSLELLDNALDNLNAVLYSIRSTRVRPLVSTSPILQKLTRALIPTPDFDFLGSM